MASVLVNVPAVQRLTGQRNLTVAGESVHAVIANLEERYPGVRAGLVAPDGAFQGYLLVVARYAGETEFTRITDPADGRPSLTDLHFLTIPCGG